MFEPVIGCDCDHADIQMWTALTLTLIGCLVTGAQSALGLDLSSLSTMYPVMGLPPSFGAFHSMSIKSLSASTIFGFSGASGAAAQKDNKLI